MNKYFVINIDIPNGVSVKEMQEYIKQEVRCGCGALDPLDPLFWLDRNSVEVKLLKEAELSK